MKAMQITTAQETHKNNFERETRYVNGRVRERERETTYRREDSGRRSFVEIHGEYGIVPS